MRKIRLLKSGNRMVVSPTTQEISDLLTPELTFTEVRTLHGKELRMALNNGAPRVELTDWECFGQDIKGRLSCAFGFWKRVKHLLNKAGYKVTMVDLIPHQNPEVFRPRWERVLGRWTLRPGQDEFLLKFLANRCGRFNCPPGYGKSFLIGLIATLLPKARIDVVSKSVTVLRDRIYPELCQMVSDVGIVGGTKKRTDRRIMCYTAGSAHHADGTADILIGDECHELASDGLSGKLGRWDTSRNYGLSATHEMRKDGKDLRVEGIFGPIVYEMTRQHAESLGIVVPTRILWRSVIMNYNPCESEGDSVERKRLGIWTNDYRNDLIAKDALQYGDNQQTLITTETIEHAMNLKKRLPNFTLAHRQDALSERARNYYVNDGCIDADEPHLDSYRREQITKAFQAGKGIGRKVIVTTIFNAGVDAPNLRVLLRGDAGNSPINDTQIPGRSSRVGPDDKEFAIVHDYLDQFDSGFERRAGCRGREYTKQGFEQIYLDRPEKGTLADQTYFEFVDDEDGD